MNDWIAPTDPETVARRAAGRRRYNSWRQLVAEERRAPLACLRREYGFRRGALARAARELGVAKSTITGDVRALLAAGRLQ